MLNISDISSDGISLMVFLASLGLAIFAKEENVKNAAKIGAAGSGLLMISSALPGRGYGQEI